LFIATKEFEVGNYVYLKGDEGVEDRKGTIVSVNKREIYIKPRSGEIFTVEKKDWPRLLSNSEIEGKRNISQEGRSDFRVQQICLYVDGEIVRPCIIVQLKPHCKIRTFHRPEPIQVPISDLIRASSSLKNKMFKTAEYRRFIEMVLQRPFDQTIPVVTEDISMLGFEDRRRIEPIYHEESEIIPASIETRQYSGFPGDESLGTPVKRQSAATMNWATPGVTKGLQLSDLAAVESGMQPMMSFHRPEEGTFSRPAEVVDRERLPVRFTMDEPVLRAPPIRAPESNSMMPLAVGAVILVGAIFMFNK